MVSGDRLSFQFPQDSSPWNSISFSAAVKETACGSSTVQRPSWELGTLTL